MKPGITSIFWVLTLLGAAIGSDAQPNTPNLLTKKSKEDSMNPVEANKQVIRNLYETTLNKHQLNKLDQFVAEDYAGVNGARGPAGFASTLQPLINAFPDVEWHIEEIIAERDNVMIRWTFRGTHLATYQELAATGRKVSIYGIGIFTLRNGKAVSGTSYTDRLGFLQGLGVLPADIGAPVRAPGELKKLPDPAPQQ
ncbi:ester cyclase [Paraflavitalea pollutisoli]|uniref:ester cyclase n=1 Tax=Paraflavitalea pollutisoli TaxID=3034143 RepID=UPI0023EE00AC|nr:ester cyclase [Paraflavitalea sp. H1-2-19X]